MLRAVVWEPDLVARRTAASVLKLSGFAVVDQPGSADEALTLTSRVAPAVLLFSIPSDDNPWASRLAEAREQAPDTRIVAFTHDPQLRAKAAAAGVTAVLDTANLAYLDDLNAVITEAVGQHAAADVAADDDDGDGDDEEWLPLRQAALAAGVPLARLRGWCDRGAVPYRKDNGRRLVLVDDVRARAEQDTGEAPAPAAEPPPDEVPAESAPISSRERLGGEAPSRESYDLIPAPDSGRRARRRR